MDAATLALFIPACFAINMAPGPNNLLAISNATRYGFAPSVMAGLGRLTAFAAMIGLTSVGLAVVLYASEMVFTVIKVAGALYLLWLALKLWRADGGAEAGALDRRRGQRDLLKQEFLVAAGNPKAIVVFTAFLPQFVDPAGPVSAQFLTLGALFLAMECVAISLYALGGLYLRGWFDSPRGRRLFNRICAGLLASAGVGLLAARRG